jgi:hypothetical protein
VIANRELTQADFRCLTGEQSTKGVIRMLLGLNNVQIIGNLGGPPEMKDVNNNDHVVNFSVAVNERWKNRNGVYVLSAPEGLELNQSFWIRLGSALPAH